MSSEVISLLALTVPVVAGIVGWALLWRRNVILTSFRNVHFCGNDLTTNGFWAPSKAAAPLMDAYYVTFTNFGLKHLDQFEFVSHNVSADAVFHPCHGNALPVTSFTFERGEGTLLKVTVREIPAFEKFSVAVLNTHPSRRFRPKGSGKDYVLKPRRQYLRRLAIRSVFFLVLFAAAAFAVMRLT